MKKLVCSLVLLLVLAVPGLAQTVILPNEVKGLPGAWIVVAPEKLEGGTPTWRVDPNLSEVRLDLMFPPEVVGKMKGKVFQAFKAGRYKVEAWIAAEPGKERPVDRTAILAILGDATLKPDQKVERAIGFINGISTCAIVVGDPGPDPKPEPDPKPDPKPVPVSGLKVLILYESSELSKMPAAQQSVLYGKTARDHLDRVTPFGPDGKTKEWRIWDKDINAASAPKVWQDMLNRPRLSVPWVVLSDGAGAVVHEAPLPANVADFLALIDKYSPKSFKKAG